MAEEETDPAAAEGSNADVPQNEVENEVTEAEGEDKQEDNIFYDIEVDLAEPTTSEKPKSKQSLNRCVVKKKKKPRRKCEGRFQWDCEKEALWRIYMQTHVEDTRKHSDAEREQFGEFNCMFQQPADLPRWLNTDVSPIPPKFELNAFTLQKQQLIDGGIKKERVYKKMEIIRPCEDAASKSSVTDFEWPKIHPCTKRDVVKERKILARKIKMKKMGALPCEIDDIDSPESSDDEKLQELAHLKELGHARIPLTCYKKTRTLLVDRASGEQPGLVDGDYILSELVSKKGHKRTLPNVCLRGLTGMHLPELERSRLNTWKFCLYQGLVALLVKTQLRYKYAWGANIDYIYQHAWMLFLHMGNLDIVPNQRFDDVLVYNYKYSVELELVQQLDDVQTDPYASVKYSEKTLKKQRQRCRRELTLTKAKSFTEGKCKDEYRIPVHRTTRLIERWFNKLGMQFTNCIFRTPKFSLAFWMEGSFWYLYNPYRCDKFGFWNDEGYACIVKFCSRDALRRHLMVLFVRAFAYDMNVKPDVEDKQTEKIMDLFKDKLKEGPIFSIQIYHIIYHSCQIHNVKLLQRSPRKPKIEFVEKKEKEQCTFDPHAHLTQNPCKDMEKAADDFNVKMEKPSWIQDQQISWKKYSVLKAENEEECEKKNKWHGFDVVKPRRLYVLYGGIHITDRIFPEENRSRQTGACYAVCAGMSLVNAPEYWAPEVLDAIVVCGDKFYTERSNKIRKSSSFCDPTNEKDDDWDMRPFDQFKIGEMIFSVMSCPVIRGRLYTTGTQSLWSSVEQLLLRHRFAILSCESARLGVFKHCGAYYICDVRSYGPPIFDRGNGSGYLLRATCFVDFISSAILIIGSPECSEFTLRPLEIVKIVDVGDQDECGRTKVSCKEEKCGKKVQMCKGSCPLQDEKRKPRKKGKRLDFDEEKKNANKTICTMTV